MYVARRASCAWCSAVVVPLSACALRSMWPMQSFLHVSVLLMLLHHRDFAVAGLHPGSVPPSAFSQFTGHANHSTPNNPTNNPTDSLTNNDHAGNQTNGHSSNNHPTSASANGQIAPSDTSPTESDGLPSLRALTHLLSRLVFNSHTICDAELRPVGMGLYPLASMANHSDQPSCLQSFIGSTICFRYAYT